jgi:hypothetical protein
MTPSGGRPRAGRRPAAGVLPVLLACGAASGAPPEPVVNVTIRLPDPGARPVFDAARVRRWLRPLLASGCDADAARAGLDRRYRFLGYVPAIETRCAGEALEVSIRESSHRIALIAFDAAELGRRGLRTDPFYEETRRLYPVGPDTPRPALRALIRTREGDLYNHERYRTERQALERMGYTLAFVPLPPAADDEYPSGAYLVQGLAPPQPAAGDPGRRRNYAGGSASYGPRRGGAVGAQYQRDGLVGRLDRLSVAPLYNASWGGSLSYTAPLLADRREPERLYDLTFDFYSDFLHDRLLDGVETDQRTTGASIVLGVRPVGLAPRHDLRLEAGLRHERLDLEEDLPGAEAEDLAALRLGLAWTWRHADRWPSLTARLVPAIDLAGRVAGGDRTFVRTGLEAGLHVRHLSGWETDLRFFGGTIDRDVPSFEQWSLGGAASVRGFREDFRLGRHLAALQAEVWFPLARTLEARAAAGGSAAADDAATPPIEPRAARLLKGALIVDTGYVAGTSDGDNIALAGAGIGLRFLVPRRPLVVKIDYAWGLGGRGGDGFPYVALGYRF